MNVIKVHLQGVTEYDSISNWNIMKHSHTELKATDLHICLAELDSGWT